ncbi:MAG: type IA DNA topoisomerase [Lachnospiraceae bacterium]|nr:type IA DNA topoisomerase [Lachnospiraceae bacterium]
MEKRLFIAEKPSVAREFAKALKISGANKDGYIESEDTIVTWCVGHLITMSYPDAYDERLKRWSLDTLPFIPNEYKYEVIDNVSKQFRIVSGLLTRSDVTTIYVCTDSGREGEYIYRLVEMQAHVTGKTRKRVWIDSQTEEEILRGVREAKDLSEYDNLCAAAYLRAKEDYLMGINFSRVLTLKYGGPIKNYLKADRASVSVGRVMTCVLGMVVKREREIRAFVKTPFYRVIGSFLLSDKSFDGEWRAGKGSIFENSPALYKENGFLKGADARALISHVEGNQAVVEKLERKKENKNPPLLYNLAELQNDCSKYFKISPDETLSFVQDMYEKKLLTYPRTDARVLSSAVAKEIDKNIRGLMQYEPVSGFAALLIEKNAYRGVGKSRYVNDKQITDHYAIIPTGQGLRALEHLSPTAVHIYELVARRFLSIFYPAAVYEKVSLVSRVATEQFVSNVKVLKKEGYLAVARPSFMKKENEKENAKDNEPAEDDMKCDEALLTLLENVKKGSTLEVKDYQVKEGETKPPKRYNSGSMILTMENAGQFIEDEELRAQIKGSGIGTSATRAEILKKLVHIKYLKLNKKTQLITPTLLGEMIYDVVDSSMKALLDPALTASWEKGLSGVADGSITETEYLDKLNGFVTRRTEYVKQISNQSWLYQKFDAAAGFYQ